MRRLIFVNKYFSPDHSASSQILSDLAFDLARTGREIHVVTSRQIYDDPKATLPIYEIINGVQVHRVYSTRFGRIVLAGRLIDFLSFCLSARRLLERVAGPSDVIVIKTDPPFLANFAVNIAQRKKAVLINWLQDVFPEVAVVLGVPFVRGPVADALTWWRNRALRAADANVVIGQLTARKLEGMGLPPGQIQVISNWCNELEILPLPSAENPLRRTWKLQGKFVVGYSGNLGRVHEFDTVLAAAELLRTNTHIVFLMIGDGKLFDQLKTTVDELALNGSFRFLPYQDRSLLRYSLTVPDVHWVSLNPKLEGLSVPSKFYGAAAAGRPIVFIGDVKGELGQLVQEYDCGVAVAAGDVDALVRTLSKLSNDPDAVAAMGLRARKMVDARFARQNALDRWRGLLDELE